MANDLNYCDIWEHKVAKCYCAGFGC